MPVQLHTKKAIAKPVVKEEAHEEEVEQAKPAPTKAMAKPAPAAAKPAAKAGGLAFLKKGKDAQETLAKEDLKQEMNSKGKVSRYWVKEDTDGQITFLDGQIVDGALDVPFFYEHNVNMNGKWGNFFICTQDTEPCPVCEGSSNPRYVAVFTVIDHSEYKSTKDNKVYKDQKRLFVATRDTVKLLQKKALKWGGLAGVKFDVSRVGHKSPSVGNVFDFVERMDEAKLVKLYGENAKPYNYEEILANMYLPAKELRKLGFGAMHSAVGSEKGVQEDDTDYSAQM